MSKKSLPHGLPFAPVKVGVLIGCYLVFQMAEVAVPRELFGRILNRIAGRAGVDHGPIRRLANARR